MNPTLILDGLPDGWPEDALIAEVERRQRYTPPPLSDRLIPI